VFTDVVPALIKELETRKTFKVRVVGAQEKVDTVKIAGAVLSNSDAVFDEITKADIITTAVGPRILERIAPTLAKGLEKRRLQAGNTPVNIIACENAIRASSTLKDFVLKELSPEGLEWATKNVGFVDCAVDRIVPPATHDDILEVTVEDFSEWVVDKHQFVKSRLPTLSTVKYADNLIAFIERKLMTVNTGHAICAYLGHLYGHTEIRESILDPKIRAIVKGAMTESGAVLVKRYNLDPKEHGEYIDKIIGRFENSHIRDEVTRVGREPIRKLATDDRLVKPLLGCLEYKLPCDNLVIGIAAALLYNDPHDPQSVKLQQLVQERGLLNALREVSGLTCDDTANNPLKQNVLNACDSLNRDQLARI